MSKGKIKLFGPFTTSGIHIVDVLVLSGDRVLAITENPPGISLLNQGTGGLGPVHWMSEPLTRPSAGPAERFQGRVWIIFEKTASVGGPVLERGVVRTLVQASGKAQFPKAGPTFGLDVQPRAVAAAGDGSVWVALRSLEDAVPSRLDRIRPPQAQDSTPHPDIAHHFLKLPATWSPLLLATGEPTNGADPGFLYLLASSRRSTGLVLARAWPHGAALPTDKLVPGSDASLVAHVPVEGTPHGLIRASDGSVWGVGSDGSSGWMFHHAVGGSTEVWKDPGRQYQSLVEGPKHTNSQGSLYHAMFLTRRFKVGGKTQSDIVTFRGDPEGGVGWITAPPVTQHQDGTTTQPTIAIERLSPDHDGEGRYWFGYIAPGVAGNVFGIGRFEPPEGDPLDQP